MTVRAVEGKQPYTGGTAIEIDENKVISLRLRDENNLIIYDAGDNEIYVDLQLPDELTPTDAFPVGITTGRVIVDNGWDLQGTLICAKTTSGDNIKLLYADEGTLWIDNGTGTFKQILFKSDVDGIITTLTTYINGELAKKQNGVTSATAPANPAEGDLWYDTTRNTLKVYNGSSWVATGGGGGSGDVVVSTDTGNELSTGVALWFGTESDFSSISTPDTNTLYIQYKSDGGEWQPGADTLLYMKFNDNLDDDSGNSNTMTGSGIGYETVSGTTKCVKLTNVNGGISGPNNLVAPVGTGDFTASFWVKPVNTATALPVLFSNSSSSSPRPGIQMYITYGTALGSYTNKVLFFIADANHVGESTTSASSLIGTWHHFLFTRANGVCSGYIDGVQEMTSWTENTSLSGVNSLYILNRANEPGQKWQDTGTCMSELIIEKKGWSAQEVADYFDQTKSLYGIS